MQGQQTNLELRKEIHGNSIDSNKQKIRKSQKNLSNSGGKTIRER